MTGKHRRPARLSRGPYRTRTGTVLTDADFWNDHPLAPASAPLPLPELYRSVSITVITDRNASAARVSLCDSTTGRVLRQATGSAKREPGDRDDPVTADGLALGRALIRLGEQLCEEQLAAVQRAAREKQQEHARVISRQLAHAEHISQERRFPQHHDLSAEQIRQRYGTEAADKHLARLARRRNGGVSLGSVRGRGTVP